MKRTLAWHVSRVSMLLFMLSWHVAVLGLLMAPQVVGFNYAMADGRSLDTDRGVVVVSHTEWLLAWWSTRLFLCGVVLFPTSVAINIAASHVDRSLHSYTPSPRTSMLLFVSLMLLLAASIVRSCLG